MTCAVNNAVGHGHDGKKDIAGTDYAHVAYPDIHHLRVIPRAKHDENRPAPRFYTVIAEHPNQYGSLFIDLLFESKLDILFGERLIIP